MDASKRSTKKPKRRGAPAKTTEARENQLISLAVDLAEEQLSNGTASAQVITHFLKLGTTKERLEKEKLANENLLLQARADAIKSAQRNEELYLEALRAMSSYKGSDEGVIDETDD